MLNNSIKSNLTKDDIISDIRLTLGADIHRSFVYIIVEGEDDIKFWKSELNDNVYLYESYDGKNGVEIIAGEVFKTNKRVIGIRDRDYSDFETGTNQVYTYDNSCMEMMFLEDEVALEKICCEFYQGSMNNQELKEHVLSELCFLGCVRKLNEQKSWELILKGISVSKACDKRTLKLCTEKLKTEINKMNNSKFDSVKSSEVDSEVITNNSIEDFLLITQGHDFANLFATICNFIKPKSKGISGKNVEECLRCAFTHQSFTKTKLYGMLVNHQEIIDINFLVA